jgi:hypothetical protein
MRNAIRTLVLFLSLAATTALFAQSEVIQYQWLNQWCSSILDCDEGCMACNLPESSSAQFFGTNVVWIGVDICPHPVASGDNAVGSFGWTDEASTSRYIMLSGIATNAVQIDSVIIRHARSAAGPDRLKVGLTRSAMEPVAEVADLNIESDFNTDILTDLGCLTTTDDMPFGSFQIQFTPYGSNDGGWYLDEVRIVATPCDPIILGVGDLTPDRSTYTGPWFDVLGRPVYGDVGAGVYIGGKRQVKVF